MKSAYARVQAAQLELDATYASLARGAKPLRDSLRRHPATWLVGGGFIAGLAAGLLPVHRWVQTGLQIASTGARLLTPLLAGIEAESLRSEDRIE